MRVLTAFLVYFVFTMAVYGKAGRDRFAAKRDSTYIESYYKDLIVRIYSDQKTHSLELNDLANPYRLRYLPNGYINIGLGVDYRFFGVSLATRIPFLGNNDTKYGKTKRFGIQSYYYTNRFTFDFLSSFSKGYYLTNSFEHLASYNKDLEYKRPDMASSNIGLSVNYVFNNTRFSCKAAFTDTDWQKKNAGSFLAGASILSYRTRADSAFVPRGINDLLFTKSRNISKSGILAFNINGGYAYTLVFLKNGMVTLSYMGGAGVQKDQFNTTSGEGQINWRVSFNQTGRAGIGYRYRRYDVKVVIIRSTQYTSLTMNDLRIENGIDYVQLSLSRRLSFR